MKFITLTLNPALDMTVAMSTPFSADGVNRSEEASFSPGGKGINVSRALCALGYDSDAICILGGFTGAKVKSMLTAEGVRVRAIATTAETRMNISVISPGGRQCEINNPPGRAASQEEAPASPEGQSRYTEHSVSTGTGISLTGDTAARPAADKAEKTAKPERSDKTDKSDTDRIRPAAETAQLLAKVRLLLRRLIEQNGGETCAVILAGSIPPDMPKNSYADLTELCHSLGAVVICDCDGDALRYAVGARPDYIKPNLSELCELTERRLTKEQVPAAAAEICVTTGGTTAVIATVGPDGAYLCRGKYQFTTPGTKVDRVRSLKGAGDTFLAAFLAAHYEKGMKEANALNFASRAAARKIATPGGAYPDLRGL